MIDYIEYGYFGLFLASFLAATILPFSSEALLALMLLGPFDVVMSITVASFGNWLGGMSSYLLGWLGKWEWIEKYWRVNREKVEKQRERLNRYSYFFALLCWAPVIGDLIAIALGFVRSNVWLVSIFMFIGKALRYIILSWLVLEGKKEFL